MWLIGYKRENSGFFYLGSLRGDFCMGLCFYFTLKSKYIYSCKGIIRKIDYFEFIVGGKIKIFF